MKKIFSLILSVWIICSVTACSSNENSVSEPVQTATTQTVTETVTEEPTIPPAQIISTDEKSKKAMKRLETLGYSGVVSVVKDGKLYCSYAKGMLEDGTIITTDTPMPVGSVSKQFCACAVMLLQEQGKLNVSDKLEKYFQNAAYSYLDITNCVERRFRAPAIDKRRLRQCKPRRPQSLAKL